jgi:hypothetical protein
MRRADDKFELNSGKARLIARTTEVQLSLVEIHVVLLPGAAS